MENTEKPGGVVTIHDKSDLPDNQESQKQHASVMNIEATVDATPQELQNKRKIVAFEVAVLRIPAVLTPASQIVLQCLFSVFAKNQSIGEGLVGDIIWGFSQPTEGIPGGIPPELTTQGLTQLNKLGFVKFQAKDNTYIDFNSDKITGAIVRYQNKLKDLIYEDTSS